jgi:hypothetical protein
LPYRAHPFVASLQDVFNLLQCYGGIKLSKKSKIKLIKTQKGQYIPNLSKGNLRGEKQSGDVVVRFSNEGVLFNRCLQARALFLVHSLAAHKRETLDRTLGSNPFFLQYFALNADNHIFDGHFSCGAFSGLLG